MEQGSVFIPVCYSVCSEGGGRELCIGGGVCIGQGLHPGRRKRGLNPGDLYARGRGSASREVCIQGKGVCIQEGGRALQPGGGMSRAPSLDTMGYGQRVGGTHPTGMHSCWLNSSLTRPGAELIEKRLSWIRVIL